MGNRRYAAAHGYIFSSFAILEDFGILPRFAFNLDYPFENAMPAVSKRSQHVWGLDAMQ